MPRLLSCSWNLVKNMVFSFASHIPTWYVHSTIYAALRIFAYICFCSFAQLSTSSPTGDRKPLPMRLIIAILFLFHLLSPTLALDFLFNSFSNFLFNSFSHISNATDVTLINDARFDGSVIRLTNDFVQYSVGRFFHPTKLAMRRSSNSTSLASFSTSFVFSVLPQIASSPGFGLCFVLSNSTSPPNALASQYFGLFTNATVPVVAPLLAIEFDTGRNPEFNDPDGNHIGIDLNNIESAITKSAGCYNSTGGFVPIQMRTGQNVRTWIEFDGINFEINVTVAPANVSRPSLPTLSFRDPQIANYVSSEMFMGFSASKTQWIEAQRVLAWSFSDTGALEEINVTNLPVFELESKRAGDRLGLKLGLGIGIGGAALLVGCLFIVLFGKRKCAVALVIIFCYFFRKKQHQNRHTVEAFLRNYGPVQVTRYSYSDVKKMTNSFKEKLGQGGYGGVYKGKLKDGSLVAVKVLNRSKGNGEEFMNEVAAISRTSHVHIVSLFGFCFQGSKRALIYEFMPNGSLDKFIFDANKPQKDHHLGWETLDRISLGIARGLEYLHRGCNTRILHFDIKPHNILLDENFSPKISDFGLAKICDRKKSIVSILGARGTAGYVAPEVFCRTFGGVSHKSDVYSFGMMLSEMVGGRRNINAEAENTSEIYFPDWIYKRLELDEELGLQSIMNEEDKVRARKMIIVSLWCIQTDPLKRPATKEVIEMLEGSVESLRLPPKPYSSSPPKVSAETTDSSITSVSVQ